MFTSFMKFGSLYLDEGAAGGGKNDGGKGANNNNADDGKGEGETLTFDAFYEKQSPEVKALLDGNTKGLKSALESEREIRKTKEKELRDLAKKAEDGSEAQKKLTEMADTMAETDRKADFYDAAHKAGVANLKLAYLAAVQEELFDKKGNVNFDEMKKSYPELFGGTKPPKGNAGDGTDDEPNSAVDMNARIRRASGRN